ncbi:MAG: HEPN domain-containing protein [Candidatus Melainabacteria bacterium]|nr:HEPN domain-containing protein [Candidatus Melainabacteria bacterium]
MNHSQDTQAIDEIVSCLVARFKPEQVYFYGSRARGDHWEGSDYDFMVVVSNDTSKEDRDRARIKQVLAGMPAKHHYDVKVWTNQEFSRQLHLKASLPSRIMREGRLVYGTPDAKEPSCHHDVPEDPSAVGHSTSQYDPLLVELTSRWLREAKESILRAQRAASEGSTPLQGAMYHCQQAAVQVLKAFLIWHDYPFRHSHNLELLCADSVIVDQTLDSLIEDVPPLVKWDMLGRYFDKCAKPTKAEVDLSLMNVCQLYEGICKRLPWIVHPVS